MTIKSQIASIRERRFRWFKKLWGMANTARVVGAMFPAVALTISNDSALLTTAAPAFVAALSVVALDLLAKRTQRMAEKAQQLEERWAILGWEPSEMELRDFFLDEGAPLSGPEEESYWEIRTDNSSPVVSSIRKVQESAWWTEQLAYSHFVGCAVVATVVVALVLAALFGGATATPTSTAVLAIAAILIIDLPNTTVAYWRLNNECASIGQSCGHLLAAKTLKKEHLTRLLLEYQLIKSGSPPILQWVYNLRRKRLNTAWDVASKAFAQPAK